MFTFAHLDCYIKAARFSAQWLYDIKFMFVSRDQIIGLNNIFIFKQYYPTSVKLVIGPQINGTVNF